MTVTPGTAATRPRSAGGKSELLSAWEGEPEELRRGCGPGADLRRLGKCGLRGNVQLPQPAHCGLLVAASC